MSEETVFWDLNYAIKYKSLGTEDIQTKVLKVKNNLFPQTCLQNVISLIKKTANQLF